jgi:hypothetical protein
MDYIITAAFSFAFGILVGAAIYSDRVDQKCQNGWHWKDVDYSYLCEATPRP